MRLTLSTIVLLTLGVIVAGGAAALERIRPVSEVIARAAPLPVFGEPRVSASGRALPVDPVELRLTRGGEEEVVIRREGRGWHQVKPFAHPMETGAIEGILQIAAATRAVGRIAAAQVDERALGFDPPHAVMSLRGADDQEVTIRFGTRGLAGRAFLRVDDSRDVLVTEASLHETALVANPADWRDRRVFHYAGADSQEITIRSGEMLIHLEREGRRWNMRSPAPSRTNEPMIDRLLEDIGRARSRGFIVDQPEDLARFGLESPAGEITIRSRRLVAAHGRTEAETESVTERIRIGARMGASTQDRFGIIEGRSVVVRIPESVLRGFFRSPLDFVAMNATDVARADVRSVTIRPFDGSGPFELERDLDDWRDAASGEPVDARTVEQLLVTLSDVQATSVELSPWPRERDTAIITLSGWSGHPIATIRVARLEGRANAPGPWIMDNGDNILRVHTAMLELPLAREAFQPRTR